MRIGSAHQNHLKMSFIVITCGRLAQCATPDAANMITPAHTLMVLLLTHHRLHNAYASLPPGERNHPG
jgi:hypothetical protein